jgi:hypothetical protein
MAVAGMQTLNQNSGLFLCIFCLVALQTIIRLQLFIKSRISPINPKVQLSVESIHPFIHPSRHMAFIQFKTLPSGVMQVANFKLAEIQKDSVGPGRHKTEICSSSLVPTGQNFPNSSHEITSLLIEKFTLYTHYYKMWVLFTSPHLLDQ